MSLWPATVHVNARSALDCGGSTLLSGAKASFRPQFRQQAGEEQSGVEPPHSKVLRTLIFIAERAEENRQMLRAIGCQDELPSSFRKGRRGHSGSDTDGALFLCIMACKLLVL